MTVASVSSPRMMVLGLLVPTNGILVTLFVLNVAASPGGCGGSEPKSTQSTTTGEACRGGVFKFQKPFSITQADLENKVEFVLDLVLNSDGFAYGQTPAANTEPVVDKSGNAMTPTPARLARQPSGRLRVGRLHAGRRLHAQELEDGELDCARLYPTAPPLTKGRSRFPLLCKEGWGEVETRGGFVSGLVV